VRTGETVNLWRPVAELSDVTAPRAAGKPRVARGRRPAGARRAVRVPSALRTWAAVHVPPAARTPAAVLLAVVVGLLALLAPAGPAAAHAAMIAANPDPGSIIGTSPAEITVAFSEAVAPVTGKVQVLAPDGKRISGTPSVRGVVLHIPVRRADRPLGTYLVSYRVISADSHPVAGAFTFSVGAPSARAPEPASDEVHPSVAVAVPVVRYVGYLGLILAIGPALFLALLWPRGSSRRGPVRLVRTGLVLIGLSTVAAIWLQGLLSSGAALTDGSGTGLADVLDSSLGRALTARLAILLVIAVLLVPLLNGQQRRTGQQHPTGRQRPTGRIRTGILLALTVAGLTTWPLSGHAAAAPFAAVVVAADVVHIAALAVWLGGLVTLAVFLLPRAHPRVLGVILPAWSRWAALAVTWLVGGGAVQAVVQVGSVGAIWTTGYGRLLLAKVVLLGLVLGIASYARRLVRRAQVPAGATRLRRTVGVEVAATAVILAVSAVLVQVNPGRTASAEQAADAVEGVSQTLTCPLFTLQFNIYPVQIGDSNTVHAYVYTADGKPLPAQEWSVTTVLLGRNLEPVTTRMLAVPPHHAIGAVTFPLAGVYEVRFTVRTTETDEATVATTVTVP
jgi:copper transport protein